MAQPITIAKPKTSVCGFCHQPIEKSSVYLFGPDFQPHCWHNLFTGVSATPDMPALVACHAAALGDYRSFYDDAMSYFGVFVVSYTEGGRLQRARDTRLTGCQLEHMIPNSCFIAGTGRGGPVIHGGGRYTEGGAMVFPVEDGQRRGTEHKMLTNIERSFAKLLHGAGMYANALQWLQVMVVAWERILVQHRRSVYQCNKVGLNAWAQGDPFKEPIYLDARRAARAMARHARKGLASMHVKSSARLKNGLVGLAAAAPPARLAAAHRFAAF